MKRRAFLQRVPAVLAGSALVGLSGRAPAAADASVVPHPSSMNVLFLAIDGLRADALSGMPHLNAFATRAARFNRCYCQVPQYDRSRLSILTGVRPEDADAADGAAPGAGQPLPEFLARQGVHCEVIAEPSLDPEILADRHSQFFLWIDLSIGEGTTPQTTDAYYGAVTSVDQQVGVWLDALKCRGLDDRTIVFIFGTHGVELGEHDCRGAQRLFEQATRVPLLVRVPGVTSHDTACDEIVELVDLFPTLCDLLLIPAPSGLEGTSLAPLLVDPRRPWKLAAFSTCTRDGAVGRSVRTKRWRYTDWQSSETALRRFELYDLDHDPAERINLALDGAYRNPRTILANLLQRGWYIAQQNPTMDAATAAAAPAHPAQHILW